MNGTMFSMFSFVNRGISFVLLIILARYIAPAEYGRLSLFNTIVELLGYIVALSCQGFFSISYFQRKGELFRQDTSSIIIILIFCSSILGFILFIFQTPFANYADLPPLFLWIALAISSIQILVYLLIDYLRVQEKVVKYGFLSCGIAILNFLLSIYLVVFRNFSWTGQLYASLICTIFFGCLGLVVAADNLLFFSFQEFVDFAKKKGTSCIMCHEQPSIEKLQRTGVVELDNNNKVLGMEEKPQVPKSHWAVPPFYIYLKKDLNLVRHSVKNGCGKDAPGNLAHYMVEHTTMHAWPMSAGRFDIGSLDTYYEAIERYGK